MVGAIDASSSAYCPVPVSDASVVLEAQLSRYQVQLADWVSCPSGKTPEGKAKIAEISDKISRTEQRLREVESPRAPPPSEIDMRKARISPVNTDGTVSDTPTPTATGRLLDVYA